MTNRRLNVVFLPQMIESDDLRGSQVVVTDVLRASTTIVTALDRGAACIVPTAEIADALRLKSELPPPVVLGGERGGVIIAGFDQGNSPLEFTPEVIGGKKLVLCTTNGTVALAHCRTAERVYVGAFVNLSVVAAALQNADHVTIMCSGTNRRVTSEDILFAGAIVDRLLQSREHWRLGDQATVALGYWKSVTESLRSGRSLADELASGAGGRNLLKLGYHADIEFCARIDHVPRVPELDLNLWQIRIQD